MTAGLTSSPNARCRRSPISRQLWRTRNGFRQERERDDADPQIYIRATPEAIWSAITAPEWTSKYGYRARAIYDLKPGGAYQSQSSAQMRSMGLPEVIIDGEVVEVNPPLRL